MFVNQSQAKSTKQSKFSYAYIDDDDGMLTAKGIPFDMRGDIDKLGGIWSPEKKAWKFIFTIERVEQFLSRIPDIVFEQGFAEKFKSQKAREIALEKIRALGKQNADVNFKVPGLKLEPYNYQKLGMMYAITNGSGVLIADEMGLGKTIQGIGVAEYLKSKGLVKKVLVVTPASLKYNWPLEISKFTDEKCIVIDGTPEKRMKQWMDDSAFFYIVNYELLVDLFGKSGGIKKKKSVGTPEQQKKRFEQYSKIRQRQALLDSVRSRVWDLCIVDEAHALKHHLAQRTKNVKQIRARLRIALTGTPLDGRLEELHSVMQWVMPGLLCNKKMFFDRYVTTDIFGTPCGYRNVDELKEKIKPFFIRRLKTDVLKSLPPKIYLNKLIELSDQEKKAYKEIADVKNYENEGDALTAIIRCKQFCDYPEYVVPSVTNASKLDVFLDMIDEIVGDNGHKVLVFSQYTTMLDVIELRLRKQGYTFLRIDGNTPTKDRAAMQEAFNKDPKIDMVIASEAGSTGLNLQAADYVFNYDDNWSPALMNQREDRAHRNGQKNTVTVVNFICKGTIEERIRNVIYVKNRVSSDVLGDDLDVSVMKRLGIQQVAKML